MQEKLEKRLKELKEEFENGKKMLGEIETKRDELQQNMLRISGAIQVLNEVLNPDKLNKSDKSEDSDKTAEEQKEDQ